MEFGNKAQQETYERVTAWMKELFGEMARVYPDTPTFGIGIGSSWTYVNVYTWGDDSAVIQCFSWVVTGAECTPDLMQFLLQENDRMRFGEALMNEIEQRARKLRLTQLFVLTTKTAHWFLERGFRTAAISDLPQQKQALYNYQRKSLVYVKNL